MDEPLMMRDLYLSIFLLACCSLVLSGCSSGPQNTQNTLQTTSSIERSQQLKNIHQWQITGKIAFIKSNNRNSASLNWKVNEIQQSQVLNLTSYLGINILQLTSKQGQHKLKFKGETYQGDDLKVLINKLTGLTLPTEALTAWIKGLSYQDTDYIRYDELDLPLTLTSFYNNDYWQISYSDYKQINHYALPSRLSIKKDNLLIKIAINTWQVTNELDKTVPSNKKLSQHHNKT